MTETVSNTGDGVKENATVESVGAGTSTVSPTSAKKNTTKTEKPITREEAVPIFQSGLSYLIQAGFNVVGINEGNQLIICIDDLQYETGRVFILEKKT